MIYEEVAEQQAQPWLMILDEYTRFGQEKERAAKKFELTQINRQLRRESQPVLYCKLQIIISKSEAATRWIEAVDSAVLNAVTFRFIARCQCSGSHLIKISMPNTESPVLVNMDSPCHTGTTETDAMFADDLVRKLEIVGGKRMMTKAILRKLVNLSRTMGESGAMW